MARWSIARPGGLVHGFTRLSGYPQYRRARIKTLWRLALWGLHCAFSRPAVITLPRFGARLYLPAGRKLGSTAVYLFREDYEPELAQLQELLSPGDVFIDAGACVGLYTAVAARLVGPTGKVVAFEPAEVTYPILERNAQLNAEGNVTTVQAALSDTVGTAELFHVMGASLYSLGSGGHHDEGSEQVATTTVDAVARQLGLPKVDCIKMDVEGAEAMVLRGAAQVVEAFRPTILLEVNSWTASRFSAHDNAIARLQRLGYRFEVVQEDRLVPMAEVPDEANVVAKPA